MDNYPLKEKTGINIAILAKTLEDTNSSYKFFWLYSLLEILKQREYKIDKPIAYRDIFYLMLKFAKTSCLRFGLSLGAKDKDHLCEYVQKIEKNLDNSKILWDSNADSILDSPGFALACRKLSQYVPSRWLHPFVYKYTVKVRGTKTNTQAPITEKIIQAAATEFKGKNPPPYYILNSSAGKGEIVVHPLWAEYFKENEAIVRSWCLWHFAHYLQKRNPNIPNIINKIVVDEATTRQLTRERGFWHDVIKHGGEIQCIYSGKLLKDSFALDHYVPWSFVGHNNLWNLIPADESVNSSKGDRLPSDKYMEGLVKAHCHALTIYTNHPFRNSKKLVESYSSDLKVSVVDLTNEQKMRDAYKMFIPPLIDLAEANGFEGDWFYEPPEPTLL